MPNQQKWAGNAHAKRNSWSRGKGVYSMRGELKHGISLRKRELNRRVRHTKILFGYNSYKHLSPTVKMVEFS